jgi:hypothetical protein
LAAQRLDTALSVGSRLGAWSVNGWLAMAAYVGLLSVPLYWVARRGLGGQS